MLCCCCRCRRHPVGRWASCGCGLRLRTRSAARSRRGSALQRSRLAGLAEQLPFVEKGDDDNNDDEPLGFVVSFFLLFFNRSRQPLAGIILLRCFFKAHRRAQRGVISHTLFFFFVHSLTALPPFFSWQKCSLKSERLL